MKNFSAHQKEEDLRISKITLLLFLVLFLGELWPLKHGNIFFGTPCTLYLLFTYYVLAVVMIRINGCIQYLLSGGVGSVSCAPDNI